MRCMREQDKRKQDKLEETSFPQAIDFRGPRITSCPALLLAQLQYLLFPDYNDCRMRLSCTYW